MQTTTTARGEDRTAGGRTRRRTRGARRAFTLTELLIVIGLIVLVITLAVPAFKAMSGGRSVDAAANQLAAILGAARAEAIGLQKVRGVFFYVDPATERVNAALVQETAGPAGIFPAPTPDYYLDLIADRDPIALPVGVGLQGVDNAVVAGTPPVRADDGYTGYNPVLDVTPRPDPALTVRWGGVVLFDGYGRVINKYYGFLLGRPEPGGNPNKLRPTPIAELLGYRAGTDAPPRFVPVQLRTGEPTPPPARSLLGFVLYDAEPFISLGHTDGDPQFSMDVGGYGGTSKESVEEAWLDKNATPVLINRYNGTLIRGE